MTAVLREREERQQTDLPPRERLGRRAPQELGTIVVGGPPNRRLYVSVCRVTDLAIALASLIAAFLLTNLGTIPSGLASFLAARITWHKLLLIGVSWPGETASGSRG